MTTPAILLLLAAFVQVAFTLWAIVALGTARIAAIKAKEVAIADIVIDDSVWPDRIKLLQANLRNQFETPLLFFAGSGITLGIGASNWAIVFFAWAYIATRIVHRIIHIGTNRIRDRFRAFVAGMAAIAGMWVSLVAGALLS